jgi:hypothetical protein
MICAYAQEAARRAVYADADAAALQKDVVRKKYERNQEQAKRLAAYKKSTAVDQAIHGSMSGVSLSLSGYILQSIGNLGKSVTDTGTKIVNNYKNYSGRFLWPTVPRSGQVLKWGALGYAAYQPYKYRLETQEINKKLEKKLGKMEENYKKEIESIKHPQKMNWFWEFWDDSTRPVKSSG